ncbi:protein MIS12 homolog [Girardinichthys multiradiatus]|uniref:protein MIS12 homolog n=1 Tax=Girardinichthys multiradiatus TaxID=208333 RepID=UPI001FADD4F0|nr:protein MIS12 homolog [Girardinichthys multiradiatus]
MARETEPEMETVGTEEEEKDRFSSSSLKLYEAQFFSFTPQTCMARIYSSFHECLCDILALVEKECVRELGKGQLDADEELLRSRARECSRKLQHFLEKRFKQLSERMEALLTSRCFTIPPNVLLPEDHSHKKYPQDIQEVLKLESSLADLHRAYEAEVCARQALLAELEEQKEVQKQLDDILEWVREMQAGWAKEGNGNFQESFRLGIESIKKLQSAVKEVLIHSKTLN